MIERHVTFDVYSGKETEFERFMNEEYRSGLSQIPGFVKLDLLREVEMPSRYQMVIRFETEAAAQIWRQSQIHVTLKAGTKAFGTDVSLRVYNVVC